MAFTSFVSDYSQKWFAKLFYSYGVSVFRRPLVYLVCGILSVFLSGLGLLQSSYENSAVYLWVPQSSDIFQNFETNNDLFGDAANEFAMIFENSKGDNLLTPSNMDLMYEIFLQTTNNISTEWSDDGTVYTFRDLCDRPYDSYHTCTTLESGFFDIFEFDPHLWSNTSSILSHINAYSSYLPYYCGLRTFSDGFENCTVGCSMIRIAFELQSSKEEELNEIIEQWQYDWEDYWKIHENDYNNEENNYLKLHFISAVSFNGEIDRVVSGDLPILGTAFLVMLVYLALTLGYKINCVEFRVFLAVGSLFSTICALIMGIGVGSILGFDLNAIVLLIPFILLGVGVDDAIIIVETLHRTPLRNSDVSKEDERLGAAMAHSGLSITLTSLSSVIAFAIGSFADIPAVSSFCLYACLSFFCNFVTQFMIFVPLLTLDERRIDQSRNFCICCYKHSNFTRKKANINLTPARIASRITSAMTSPTTDETDQPSKYSLDTTEMTATNTVTNTTTPNGHTTTNNNTVTLNPNSLNTNNTNNNNNDSIDSNNWRRYLSMEYFLTHTLVPIHSNRISRIVIICLFACLIAGSIISLKYLDTETDIKTLVPDDSFVLDYLDALDEGYGEISQFDSTTIIIENKDFSDIETRTQVKNMINMFENEFVSDYGEMVGLMDQWLDSFEYYLLNMSNISIDDVDDSEMFYDYLKMFTNTSDYKHWDNLIVYDNNNNPTKIRGTKFSILTSFTSKAKARWNIHDEMVDTYNSAMGDKKSGKFYSYPLLFAYLAYAIVGLTVNNLLFTGIGVFVALAFLMDIRMAIFIVCTIAMIDIDLLGWMTLNGIPLDTLSYGELVMAVGLTVDYVIHIAHAISHATPINPDNYHERIEIALIDMGVGVAKGAFTTFLGTMTLIFSQSQAFRVFFLMFCGIIIISVLHGFLLVPALLAECSFIYSYSDEDNKKHEPKTALERQMSERAHQQAKMNAAMQQTQAEQQQSEKMATVIVANDGNDGNGGSASTVE